LWRCSDEGVWPRCACRSAPRITRYRARAPSERADVLGDAPTDAAGAAGIGAKRRKVPARHARPEPLPAVKGEAEAEFYAGSQSPALLSMAGLALSFGEADDSSEELPPEG
jgi:hypothetical protein